MGYAVRNLDGRLNGDSDVILSVDHDSWNAKLCGDLSMVWPSGHRSPDRWHIF